MKNHLFIGLGGQGGRSLAELRKVMKQRHQDVDDLTAGGVQWDFLSIDSSPDVWNTKKEWTYFGQDIQLSTKQKLKLEQIPSGQSVDALSLRPDISPWIGQKEVIRNFLRGGEVTGANQRRRFGRLLFAQSADRVRGAIINEKLDGMLRGGGPNECWIHIFASLAGGTGSGGIVDLVTMLRSHFANKSPDGGFPIYLYLYATSDDGRAADVGYFYQNQYAALRDLNALVCGSFSPNQLGGQHQGVRFTGTDAVTGVCVSTSLNSQNYRIPIETQIRITAESCFERIFAFNSGYLGPDPQKSLTFEDIIQAFPGEPMRASERSYRFASLGMRRWEVPNEKITELLALDVISSALRQMLTNHWQDSAGYVKESVPLADARCQALVTQLDEALGHHLALKQRSPELRGALTNELNQLLQGITNSSEEGNKLDIVEAQATNYYERVFREGGIGSVFTGLNIGKETIADEIAGTVDLMLTQFWLDPVHPIPVAHLIEIIDRLEISLRSEIEALGNSQVAERLAHKRLLRRSEWAKLTFLSGPLKKKSMLQAHMRDFIQEFCYDIDKRCQTYDNDLKTAVITRLQFLRSCYNSARSVLSDLLSDAEKEAAAIDTELRTMQGSFSANKYEFDQEALDSFRSVLRTHYEHQSSAASELRGNVAQGEWGHTLKRFRGREEQEKDELDDKLREVALRRAQDIHVDLEARGKVTKVLNESLMDRLQAKFSGKAQVLEDLAREFIGKAATCAKIDIGELQPAVVLGGGVGVPHMPRRLFILGVPQHPFTEEVRRAFINAIPAGANYVHDLYVHNDPSQLRLVLVDYWMAARFMNVTSELSVRYSQGAAGNALNDVLYFSNIDPEAEKGMRPDLLMPPAERQRTRMEAELWIGSQFEDSPPVVVDARGVHLIISQNGDIPLRLGDKLDTVVDSADIPMMSSVSAEVGRRLRMLSDPQKSTLQAKVAASEQSLRNEKGVTSPEFQRWSKLRQEINRLLS